MNPEQGDRIRLVSMLDDPCPVPAGSTGTVTRADLHDLGDGPFVQVSVEWDNGRRLMLSLPPDVVEVIEIGPATRKAMIDAANNYTDALIVERRKAKQAVAAQEHDRQEHAPAARRPRPFGLPVARLGVCTWPDGSRTLYAKGEHGDEYHCVERVADVPPFIARLFEGVDLLEWVLGREQVTLFDDGRVERVVVA